MIVEIVTKSGRVMEVHSFQKNCITIGRGYGNDLILQDPYMESSHLRVEVNTDSSEFVATDLGALNGTKANGSKVKIEAGKSITFALGKVLTLGKTNIRLRDESYRISASLKLSSLEPLYTSLSTFWVTVLTIAVATIITLREAYLIDPFSEKLLKELNAVVIFVVAAVCYGGLWMTVARLQRVDGRFLLNMNLLMLMLVLDGFFQMCMGAYNFNLGWLLSVQYFSMLVTFLLVAGVIFVSCTQTMHLGKGVSVGVAATIAFLPVMSESLGVLFPPDFRSAPAYNMTLVDERFQLRAGVTEEQFITLADKVYRQATIEQD